MLELLDKLKQQVLKLVDVFTQTPMSPEYKYEVEQAIYNGQIIIQGLAQLIETKPSVMSHEEEYLTAYFVAMGEQYFSEIQKGLL